MVPAMTAKKKVKLSNQSLVFEVFTDDDKLTVVEILERVNEKLKRESQHNDEEFTRMSDSTVRRALDSLVKTNFLRTYGRSNNAMLYGKISAAYADAEQKLITFSGELITIEDFLTQVISPEERPLQLKTPILSKSREHDIRRRLAFVIMSAGELGLNEKLEEVRQELETLHTEMAYVSNVLRGFLDSPVFYQQHRDRIGNNVREVQKKNPDLIQLAFDYIQNG